jgi:hypothetical protein
MRGLVKRLWAGDLPLRQAFWDYAVFWGLLLNLATHAVFFALLLNNANSALVALAFALPIPYNLLAVVAVWRSAGRYSGSKKWADLARVATVFWMTGLTLA